MRLREWVLPGRGRRFRVYAGLAALVLLLAWLSSALPPAASGAQSGWLKGLLEKLFGRPVDELLLRKLAHFTEYLFIGFFAGMALRQLRRSQGDWLLLFMFCLVAALIDESIQLFSGRGPAILDVWIDGAGAAVGMVLALLPGGLRRLRP